MWCALQPPRVLVQAMERRGVRPIVTNDAFRTMAEVVAGGSMGGPPGHGSRVTPAPGSNAILVLVEPSRIRGKRAMLTSCRRYASGLKIWVYQARAPVPLRPLDLAQLVPYPKEAAAKSSPDSPADSLAGHRFAPLPSSDGSSRHGRHPALRLAGGEAGVHGGGLQGGGRSADNAGKGADHAPSGLLTDEELAMLLADEDLGAD